MRCHNICGSICPDIIVSRLGRASPEEGRHDWEHDVHPASFGSATVQGRLALVGRPAYSWASRSAMYAVRIPCSIRSPIASDVANDRAVAPRPCWPPQRGLSFVRRLGSVAMPQLKREEQVSFPMPRRRIDEPLFGDRSATRYPELERRSDENSVGTMRTRIAAWMLSSEGPVGGRWLRPARRIRDGRRRLASELGRQAARERRGGCAPSWRPCLASLTWDGGEFRYDFRLNEAQPGRGLIIMQNMCWRRFAGGGP